MLKAALGYVAGAYVNDALVRPKQIAGLARGYCDRVGKPLLNLGAGMPETSLRALIFGSSLYGDVNLDKSAPRIPHGPDRVSYGDPCNLRDWSDRHFGAVIACNILEQLERPDAALTEWRRVADRVFVVVPKWWSPSTWLNFSNRWYIDPSLKQAYPVWTNRNRVFLLPVSDRKYSPPPGWKTPPLPPQPPPPMRQVQPVAESKPEPRSPGTSPTPGTGSRDSVAVLTVVSKPK
jgi:hypothetical protein